MKLKTSFIFFILFTFVCAQYRVTNTQSNSSTISLTLAYTGSDDYYIKPKSPIIKTLLFTFHCMTYSDFNFKMIDPNNKRFEVPQ